MAALPPPPTPRTTICRLNHFTKNNQHTGGHFSSVPKLLRLPGGISGKESTCQCRRLKRRRFNPESGGSPEGEHGNPPQYSCLENPMDRAVWWDTVHGVTKSWTRLKRLSTQHTKLLLPEGLSP